MKVRLNKGMKNVDVLIVGGGSAGLAAAVGAYENGCRNILILEREPSLGGILQQCIHNGFGLHMFKEELTGPEYASRFIRKIEELKIPYMLNTTVLSITKDHTVSAVSPDEGVMTIQAGAIILATGCRERPRGALVMPGTRVAGIYTAGTAQRLLNREGYMPGRRVLILGSGDIGLIMARRFTLQGAKVEAVAEIMPYSGGLARNIAQCLDDFGIPLYLSHTVVNIEGKSRVEAVTIAQVDANRKPIPGTEKRYEVDTLLLSVGLIPENEVARTGGIEISQSTKGAVVDECLSTSVPGIFACGNALHVHDLVDNVSEESISAGKNAADFVNGKGPGKADTVVLNGQNVTGIVPQMTHSSADAGTTKLMFRPAKVMKNVKVIVSADGTDIQSRKAMVVAPGEMFSFNLDNSLIPHGTGEISVRIEEA